MAATEDATAPDHVKKRLADVSIADLGTAVSIVGGVPGLVYIVGGAVLGARLKFYSPSD